MCASYEMSTAHYASLAFVTLCNSRLIHLHSTVFVGLSSTNQLLIQYTAYLVNTEGRAVSVSPIEKTINSNLDK